LDDLSTAIYMWIQWNKKIRIYYDTLWNIKLFLYYRGRCKEGEMSTAIRSYGRRWGMAISPFSRYGRRTRVTVVLLTTRAVAENDTPPSWKIRVQHYWWVRSDFLRLFLFIYLFILFHSYTWYNMCWTEFSFSVCIIGILLLYEPKITL
jgi:hypothetical protein